MIRATSTRSPRPPDHVAIGSDLDGFIKPTLGGVEDAADLAALRDALRREYGADAEKLLGANAIRVLRAVLPGGGAGGRGLLAPDDPEDLVAAALHVLRGRRATRASGAAAARCSTGAR